MVDTVATQPDTVPTITPSLGSDALAVPARRSPPL